MVPCSRPIHWERALQTDKPYLKPVETAAGVRLRAVPNNCTCHLPRVTCLFFCFTECSFIRWIPCKLIQQSLCHAISAPQGCQCISSTPTQESKFQCISGTPTQQRKTLLCMRAQINALTGSPFEWLRGMLEAFNHGDLHAYDALCSKHASALNSQPALVAHERKLREKITILCLMELIFKCAAPTFGSLCSLRIFALCPGLSLFGAEMPLPRAPAHPVTIPFWGSNKISAQRCPPPLAPPRPSLFLSRAAVKAEYEALGRWYSS